MWVKQEVGSVSSVVLVAVADFVCSVFMALVFLKP